jgi:hypothetical protein
MTTADPLGRLPSATRRRLETFTEKVDHIGLDTMPLYAARALGPDHERVAGNAELVATETGRRAAVEAARRIAWDYIERRYAEGGYHPGYGITGWPILSSGADRANLASSFAEAVTAIVLADVLDEGDVDELLGPWAALAS